MIHSKLLICFEVKQFTKLKEIIIDSCCFSPTDVYLVFWVVEIHVPER